MSETPAQARLEQKSKEAGAHLIRARRAAGLSLRELARRAGTSHATLSTYECGAKSPTLLTFFRIIEACDFAVDMQFRPRIRGRGGQPRGEELVDVLRLAAQFPARPARTLDAPNIARLVKEAHDRPRR